ncbi:MAG: hypothetical protein QOH06_5561 [Acidobacteriota bacterium]|jgi:hypothetical protein|nr:hypothetical protein [Acidobacteriota bacterium]
MRRSSATIAALLALALAPAAGAQCETSTWFQTDQIDVTCPLTPSDLADITVQLQPTYFGQPDHLQALQNKSGEIALDIEYLAPDLAPERVVVDPDDLVINADQLTVTLREHKAIKALRLVLPPESLFCGTDLVEEETSLDIEVTDENGDPQPVVSCIRPGENEASRPLDWQISAAPADDDAEDDPGVAIQFSFDREWGYNLHIGDKAESWSSNLWRLKLDGSGTTNDADFHDSVTADFSWSRNIAYLGDELSRRPFTAWWGGAYLRPETTFGDEVRDYVYGARVEALLNLKKLIGTNVGTGIRPYLALGFEQVDPDKREDGTIPDNYQRATADFLWKFSPYERIRVEVDWEAKYIVDKDDLAVLGLEDRLQDKLDLSVALDVSGQREFMPFLTYTRGAEAPRFEVVEEILFGLVWDRLFQGEAPQ